MDETRTVEPSLPWLDHYPAGVDWRAPLPPGSMVDAFEAMVGQYSSHRFLDFMDKHYTYREVGRQVACLAEGLQKMGIGKGDHVGLFLPNTPYYVIAYFAILRVGATVVNFNPLYVERELIHQIDDSGTSIMFTLDLSVLYDKLQPLLGQSALRRIVVCRMADCLPFPKSMLFPMVKHAE